MKHETFLIPQVLVIAHALETRPLAVKGKTMALLEALRGTTEVIVVDSVPALPETSTWDREVVVHDFETHELERRLAAWLKMQESDKEVAPIQHDAPKTKRAQWKDETNWRGRRR